MRQAKDLLRAARRGDPAAVARVRAVSDRPTLAAAQLALAREHGFASWPRLKAEVTRRAILDGCDLARLAALLAEDPAQATARLEHRRDHPKGRRRSAMWRCCATTPPAASGGTWPAPARWPGRCWRPAGGRRHRGRPGLGPPPAAAGRRQRPASVRRLLAHGADPDLRDPEHRRTPLEWCRHQRQAGGDAGHDQVGAILAPLTAGG